MASEDVKVKLDEIQARLRRLDCVPIRPAIVLRADLQYETSVPIPGMVLPEIIRMVRNELETIGTTYLAQLEEEDKRNKKLCVSDEQMRLLKEAEAIITACFRDRSRPSTNSTWYSTAMNWRNDWHDMYASHHET